MEFQEIPDHYKELREKINSVIDNKESINLLNVEDMKKTFIVLEEIFNERGIKYRIRTRGRSIIPASLAGGGATLVGASAVAEGVLAVGTATVAIGTVAIAGAAIAGVGTIGLLGIAAHRAITGNPDYEVIKQLDKNDIYIVYKK